MTVLLTRGDREFLSDPGEEVHTDLGVLTVPDDPSPGSTVETHLGEAFTVRALRGPDLFDHLERSGAPMMPPDVGRLVGKTGACADDRVLDAGTGTGVLAAYLGRLGADVLTFERDPEFADVARENMVTAGVAERVEVRTGDLLEHVDDLGTFDLFTLDTGDAPTAVERAPDLLGHGGYVAVYSPFVESAREVVESARDAGLSAVECTEAIERELTVDDRGTRPSTAGVGHTGYLTVARNL